MLPLLSTVLKYEQDTVVARQRARQIAALLGFDPVDQTRLATAVSELARNAYNYAQGGKVEFLIDDQAQPQACLIRVSDQGPGIPHLQEVLDGTYRSGTGMGLGIAGCRRLMDGFHIDTSPCGTVIELRKNLPRRLKPITAQEVGHLGEELVRHMPQTPMDELQQQNRELLIAMQEVEKRQDELRQLNEELTDTNRGVVALYAELDERAEHLRRMDELKTRFLSNVSHEFRTPVNSVLSLTKFLLDRVDGELNAEQERQVTLIQRSMQNLLELVNDLLDLAKMEAGKVTVHAEHVTVADMFSSLRGMFRPLAVNPAVALIFDEADELPALYTDEGKISQILRNFIANALKFTEQGEVRVSACHEPDTQTMLFSVKDTGIGIARQDQAIIFEEFGQVQHRLQKQAKGTGLGLPLSRKLAQLLGGEVHVESEPGQGSVFRVRIPLRYEAVDSDMDAASNEPAGMPPYTAACGRRALIIDDQPESYYTLQHALLGAGYEILEANSAEFGLHLAQEEKPDIIFLDLVMPEMRGQDVLVKLKENPVTRGIPVVIHSSQILSPAEKQGLEMQAARVIAKGLARDELLAITEQALAGSLREAV